MRKENGRTKKNLLFMHKIRLNLSKSLRKRIFTTMITFLIFLNCTYLQFTVQAQTSGHNKSVLVVANEKVVQVAPDDALHPGGIKYTAMVFNDSIPGPVIAVDVGDNLTITLRNEGRLIHGMTIQAGYGASESSSGPVAPGKSVTWSLKAVNAGAFLYMGSADALNGIWEQVASGMYGGMVVHGVNEKPAKEFYLVFSEIYNNADQGLFKGTNGVIGAFDFIKFLNDQPDLELTNGMAFKYTPAIGNISKISLNNNATVFKVKPNELTRWYIVNAGPRNDVALNFIGGTINVRDGSIFGNYGQQLENGQTWLIPTGSASVIETVFPGTGVYVGIDHDLGTLLKGGAFVVSATNNSTEKDQPVGTSVPPKGSILVSGNQQPTP